MLGKTDGRVRVMDHSLLSLPNDPIVPQKLIDRFNLRPGLQIEVVLGKPAGGHLGPHHAHPHHASGKKKHRFNLIGPGARTVREIVRVERLEPERYAGELGERRFEALTSVDPQPRLTLEYPGCPPACRLIDLFCPIGLGQRGMIVSPPKAGKTTLLQQIATAVTKNHPQCVVWALLLDERPEEVTDFRQNVPCTVLASSNDHPPERHCALAMLAIERAKRLAEQGKHVVIVLDSLTRLGRAFNTVPGLAQSGRTLSGGLDAGALAIPKQVFGAARNTIEAGSITIIATALVDTGSRGDQVIFEEFKGTGNMELILDRKIAERRLFPAIDLAASGTRKEDKLLDEPTLKTMGALRRRLLNMPPPLQIEQLLKALERFPTNSDLVGNPQSPARESARA